MGLLLVVSGSFKYLKQAVQQRLTDGVNEVLSECIEVRQYHYCMRTASPHWIKVYLHTLVRKSLVPQPATIWMNHQLFEQRRNPRLIANSEVGMSAWGGRIMTEKGKIMNTHHTSLHLRLIAVPRPAELTVETKHVAREAMTCENIKMNSWWLCVTFAATWHQQLSTLHHYTDMLLQYTHTLTDALGFKAVN